MAARIASGPRPAARAANSRPAAAVRSSSTPLIEVERGTAYVAAPQRRRPKGLVHFLGGAFVASVPHLTYPLLLERLADGGYTVVATPYAVTFRHLDCAAAVAAAFDGAVAALRRGDAPAGLGTWAAPVDAATHGVGHSNGALLHMLIGAGGGSGDAAAAAAAGSGIAGAANGGVSGFRASNVLISYNNLRVGEAVPVPLGTLQPAVQQLRGGGRLAAAARQGLDAAAAALAAAPVPPLAVPWGPPPPRQLLDSLRQWDPAVVQLGSVFDEVGDGFQDFTPSPPESKRLVSTAYSVPSTLLVQFTDDNTDETPEAEAMLRSNPPGNRGPPLNGSSGGGGGGGRRAVQRRLLRGTHVTPCGGALAPPRRMAPGERFGPGEALAQAAAAVLLADTHRLADEVLAFLDSQT